MIRTANTFAYKAFGLSIVSEIELPELTPFVMNHSKGADVCILIDDHPMEGEEWSPFKDMFTIVDHKVVFEVHDMASFSIENGKEIIVSYGKHYDKDLIRLYLLGTCMGVILMQRQVYPLHGSAVAIDGKAYAFVGDSGVGKSTLAAAFLSQGYELISDDVLAISIEGEHAYVTPSYPQQKLWQESLDQFGIRADLLHSIYGRETKYGIPVTQQFIHAPLPLAGVFELKKGETEEIVIEPVTGLDCVHSLFFNTYRNFLLDRLGLLEWHFNVTVQLAQRLIMYQIQRPLAGFSAYPLVALILSTINKGE